VDVLTMPRIVMFDVKELFSPGHLKILQNRLQLVLFKVSGSNVSRPAIQVRRPLSPADRRILFFSPNQAGNCRSNRTDRGEILRQVQKDGAQSRIGSPLEIIPKATMASLLK
jgi:hypothetical protein